MVDEWKRLRIACSNAWGLEQYIENFDRKGYDRLDYFMDLSPTKIREHTVSLEMKEGHAERFLKEIKNRKKLFPNEGYSHPLLSGLQLR